jgi:hypothetical protein
MGMWLLCWYQPLSPGWTMLVWFWFPDLLVPGWSLCLWIVAYIEPPECLILVGWCLMLVVPITGTTPMSSHLAVLGCLLWLVYCLLGFLYCCWHWLLVWSFHLDALLFWTVAMIWICVVFWFFWYKPYTWPRHPYPSFLLLVVCSYLPLLVSLLVVILVCTVIRDYVVWLLVPCLLR